MGQILMGSEELPQADEGAHDLDIHEDGPVTAKNTGEHGDSLLCKGKGQISPATLATL